MHLKIIDILIQHNVQRIRSEKGEEIMKKIVIILMLAGFFIGCITPYNQPQNTNTYNPPPPSINKVDILSVNNYAHVIDKANNNYNFITYIEATGLYSVTGDSGITYTFKSLETQNAVYILTEIFREQGFNVGKLYGNENNFIIVVDVSYNDYDSSSESMTITMFKYEENKYYSELEMIWQFTVRFNAEYYFNNRRHVLEKAFSFYGKDFNGLQNW